MDLFFNTGASTDNTNRKRQDYVYVKGEYQCTSKTIKQYLRRETKVNKTKVATYY